jgi:hypothetical protein
MRTESAVSGQALEPRLQTFDLLARTRNSAAVPALAAGLRSPLVQLRAKCAKLLMRRPEPSARLAIVLEWTRLDACTRENLLSAKSELENPCREILRNGSHAQRQVVLTAVSDLDLTAALPELIQLVLRPQEPVHESALACLIDLCDRWGQRARQGRDIPSVRGMMLDTLHRAIHDYCQHHNDDLIDAWLMLVCWEDALQRSLINDPRHPAFRGVLDRLWQSEHQSILELLTGYLWRNSTPGSVLTILTERAECELPFMIARMVDDHLLSAAVKRLRELAPLQSLSGLSLPAPAVAADVQRRLSLVLAASSANIEQVLAGVLTYAQIDSVAAHRTGAEMLSTCRRPNVEKLIEYMQVGDAKSDEDRRIAKQLETILSWAGGPCEVLSAAAREFFDEFTLNRLLEVVRKWPGPMCSVLARVVGRVELDIVPQLLKVLASPAPQRRLLALQVIELLDVSSEVTEQLLPLVDDPRVEVRVRAIDLLSALASPQLVAMLPGLLLDATTDVQEAATRALRRAQRKRRPSTAASSFSSSVPALLPQRSTP